MVVRSISRRAWIHVLVAALMINALARPSAQTDASGIVSYRYEPNPSEIKPKMYNWEISLNQSDSRTGTYELVQMTRPIKQDAKAVDVVPQVLVESKVITPNQDGVIHFNLYVGDKAPKENMGRRGHSGQPIIFSGIGTGSSASSWIVFPGAKIERVVPSPKGSLLLNGTLSLIQFIVSDDRGERSQTEVVLRRR
jgi:hypothetical protein